MLTVAQTGGTVHRSANAHRVGHSQLVGPPLDDPTAIDMTHL